MLAEQVSMSLDWVSYTLPDGSSVEVEMERFGGDWQVLPKGMHGYSQAFMRVGGGVTILAAGEPGMGVHVQVSGTGCGFLCEQPGHDWSAWIAGLLGTGARFTRVDVAVDDRRGLVTWKLLADAFDEGRCISRWRMFHAVVPRLMIDPSVTAGWTFYLGSRKSEAFLRVYDKGFEQGAEADGPWVRWEWEYKKQRAHHMAKVVAEARWDDLMGYCRGYVSFKDSTAGMNRSRRPEVSWWADMWEGVKRMSLSLPKTPQSLAKLHRWLEKQVAPALAVFVARGDGDLGVLAGYVSSGYARFGARHRAMVACPG